MNTAEAETKLKASSRWDKNEILTKKSVANTLANGRPYNPDLEELSLDLLHLLYNRQEIDREATGKYRRVRLGNELLRSNWGRRHSNEQLGIDHRMYAR